MLSQKSPLVVSTWVKIHKKIPNNTLCILPPANTYDVNIFFELYLWDWTDNILFCFDAWSSPFWLSCLDDIILLLFCPCREETKSDLVMLFFILVVSISFSILVSFEGPSNFAMSKFEVFRSWYDPSVTILPYKSK